MPCSVRHGNEGTYSPHRDPQYVSSDYGTFLVASLTMLGEGKLLKKL
jgi:hypothetical protein